MPVGTHTGRRDALGVPRREVPGPPSAARQTDIQQAEMTEEREAAGYPVSCCRYFARLPDSRTAARNSTTRKTGHAVEGTHCLVEGRHPDFPTVGRQPDWRTRTRATARDRRKDMLDCRQMKHLPVATQPRARDAGGNAHRKARCARGAPARGAGAPKCREANRHPASRDDRKGREAAGHPRSRDIRTGGSPKPQERTPRDSRDDQTSRRPACRAPDKPPESHATARLRHGGKRAVEYRHTDSQPHYMTTESKKDGPWQTTRGKTEYRAPRQRHRANNQIARL